MKYLFLLGSSLAVCAPVLAQSVDGQRSVHSTGNVIPDEAITVLATGSEVRLEETGQPISVIGADEIAEVQGADLARVLERLPGITFTRNGGLGSFTGVRVRGANSEQLLVLVDGIRVADTASPGGGYDFGNLTSGGLGKIELLRGSNSVVWGSEAIGGVLAVTSRQMDGIAASAEYGARDTVIANASAGVVRERYEFTVSGGYSETDGFSTAAIGSEPDGFRQWRANGRGRFALSETLSVVAAARYADSRLEFDGFAFSPPFGLIDTPEFTETEEISGRAGIEYTAEGLQLAAGYAIHDIDRANFNLDFGSEPGFASNGRQERAQIKGYWDAAERLRLDFGADREWAQFETSFDARQQAELSSGHALLSWYGDGLAVSAGARIDDHSRFGGEVTFGGNASIVIAAGWRVRASYGEGFKVPTLFQLFSDFGNGALSPERSRSYDIGIEKGNRGDSLHFAATVFRRDTRGLIDFVSCFSVADPLCDDGRFGFYQNVARARAEGFEVELGARVSERLRAQAAYSYAKATNRTPEDANRGNDLARRSRHSVTVALDWETPLAGLKLGGDIRMVSGSFDDAGNFTRLESYALGTVRASFPVSEAIEMFGRVENVTDEQYQTAAGYATPGRSAYIGARARF